MYRRSQSRDKVRPRLLMKLSRQFESSIVAMEQIDDAGLCRRNPCSFNAVDACGRLAGLASTVN